MATWFITGAARWLGYEMARHALKAGANVVATARTLSQAEAAFAAAPGSSGRLLPVTLDVTDESQAVAAAEAAIARFGAIDVLVNNAGRGLLGAVEEASAAAPARGSRTRRAVLDVTAALLAEGGLAATTIDAIRDRSGVSKTTIYKHWPNRLCVAVDAFAERLASDASLPDTGTVRGDFREQVRRVTAFYAAPVGSVFAQLLANAMQDPLASQWLQTRFLDSRQRGIQQLWDRAVSRGEVRKDIDPDLAMDLVFGPIMWRLLSGRRPLTEDEADAIVDSVLNGLRAATV